MFHLYDWDRTAISKTLVSEQAPIQKPMREFNKGEAVLP